MNNNSYTAPPDVPLDNRSLYKVIIFLALPIVLSRFVQALAGIIDIAMVGDLGASATAAVGTGRQLIFIAEMMMISIISGTQAVTAQVTGQAAWAQVAAILRNAFLLMLVASVVLGGIGYLLTPSLLRLIGAEGEVFELGEEYMRLFFLGLWAMALSHIIINVMQASGDTLTPFFVITIINVLHVVLNYLFINGIGVVPEMGVRGAALGQTASRFAGLLVGLGIVYSGRYRINMRHVGSWRPDWTLLRRILRIGLPVTAQGLSRNGASLIILRIIAGVPAATIGLAAFAIASRLIQFAYFGAHAFSTVNIILVGQSLGGGHANEAERRGWATMRLSLVIMSVIGLAFYFLAPTLVGLFTDDPGVIVAGIFLVRLLSLALPFTAVAETMTGALQGAGDTRPPLYYTVFAQWLVSLPLAYLLTFPLGFGLVGVWIAVAISPVIQAVLVANKFRSGSWKQFYASLDTAGDGVHDLNSERP